MHEILYRVRRFAAPSLPNSKTGHNQYYIITVMMSYDL